MSMNPRLLKPTASGFSPRSISGLALWLDAADGATLFQNSDGTVPATASSDPVGYWGDKSGNGRHATQATAGSRPVVGTQNGRKALTFDGTNDNLFVEDYAVESNLPGLTRFLVFESTAASQIFVTTTNAGKIATAGGSTWWQRFGANWFGYCGDGIRYHGGTADTAAHVATNFFDGSLAATFGVRLQNSIDGVLLPVVGSLGTLVATTGGSSAKLAVGSNAGLNNFVNGRLCELLCYTRALSAAERRKAEIYLARKWGITLAPQVSNADAQDWVNRVYANGGSVSTSTAQAVDTFCIALENAPGGSIRDRFLRLNLFCGTGLNAALVPLYRAASLEGTPLGNATDTNLGSPSFLVGDYNETGVNGGFKGNGSTKSLATGLLVNLIAASDSHMSVGLVTAESGSGFKSLMGANISLNTWELFARRSAGSGIAAACFGSATNESNRFGNDVVAATLAAGHIVASFPTMYRNGTAAGTTASSNGTVGSVAVSVFAQNSNGSVGSHTNARLSSYSLGLGMTASQAAAFSAAHAAFNSALGRA